MLQQVSFDYSFTFNPIKIESVPVSELGILTVSNGVGYGSLRRRHIYLWENSRVYARKRKNKEE